MNTLSVLIATTLDRRKMFENLLARFESLRSNLKNPNVVEIIWEEDNKEISIGKKRQILLESANNDYIVFFDSDDMPRENYLQDILDAIQKKPDCVGFLIQMTTNGQDPKLCCHSLKYPIWSANIEGYDFVRNVTHFNPVKRDLALQVGFQDMRFGEDKEYSDKLTLLCKEEVFIDKILFDYQYTNTTSQYEKFNIPKPAFEEIYRPPWR